MYERRKAEIDELRKRFDMELAERSVHARDTGARYLEMLTDLIRTVDEGPAADPRLSGIDTTGELSRVEDFEAWAEEERHRVRRALTDIA